MSDLKLAKIAEGLTELSVSRLSEIIEKKTQEGEKIFNFTLGDFLPQQFSIPTELEQQIILAYQAKQTNYPFVGGIKELRSAIANHIRIRGDFTYEEDEIIVASGARPLIYLLFKTILDQGEKIIYTVPSWNNQYFIYLAHATPIVLETKAKNNFLMTASELAPHLQSAVLINLNVPLNPAGTIFQKQPLTEIFDLIIAENKHREKNQKKPLYVFFDLIYWLLVYNQTKFTNPILLQPELRKYVIFIDGISKCFAATGVRVGWAFGEKQIITKMRSLLSHLGAWAPKPEQVATARYLQQDLAVTNFLDNFKCSLLTRLNIFYVTIQKLKAAGHKVDAIEPQGAIYLAIKLDLIGAKTPNQTLLKTVDDIYSYLLEDAKVALVPFYFFGSSRDLAWFRLSVGTCSIEDAKLAAANIYQSIHKLSYSQ